MASGLSDGRVRPVGRAVATGPVWVVGGVGCERCVIRMIGNVSVSLRSAHRTEVRDVVGSMWSPTTNVKGSGRRAARDQAGFNPPLLGPGQLLGRRAAEYGHWIVDGVQPDVRWRYLAAFP